MITNLFLPAGYVVFSPSLILEVGKHGYGIGSALPPNRYPISNLIYTTVDDTNRSIHIQI